MKNSMRTILGQIALPVAAAWLVTSAPGIARADDASATGAAGPEAPATTGGGAAPRAEGLQEVVVTAQRREEELSKVPISVTALTQADIDQKGIKDFLDIARYTPGVSIDNSATNAISIRGISSSAGAGTTGIYIDDTPIQMRSVGFNPDDALPKTFDIERVEILRGPQGTLFGAGAEGGAVRYILAQPSVSSTSSYLRTEVSYTEYGEPSYELGVAHGQPLVDGTFGVRVSVWYRADGGWIDRVDPTTREVVEKNINHGGTLLARLAATWQPAASFSLTPSILYQDLKKHDDSTYWPAYSDAGAGHFNTATPELIPNYDEYYLPALKMQWDLGNSQIIGDASYYHRTQHTAYQGTVYDLGYYQYAGFKQGYGCVPSPASTTTCPYPVPLIDGDGMHIPPQFGTSYATPNLMTNRQENYTAELRWQSSDPSSKLNWTTGVFWQLAKEGSLEELRDPQINAMFNYLYGASAVDIFCPNASICPGPPDFVTSSATPDYSCPTNVAYPAIPACDIYYNNNTTYDRQIAVYGELSYAFTDWFRLTVGERVAHTEFSLTHNADGLENFGPYTYIPSMPSVVRTSEKATPSTPKVVASFQVDPKNLFYASYAKGFRVGGGNAPLPSYCDPDLAAAGYPNGAPLTYRPDSTQNYEIGSKNTIGESLRIATSLYYIKWDDIQQNLYVAGACGLQFTDNLGTAAAWGGDLQAELALGQVHIDFATGYTSARYTKNSPVGCTPYVTASSGLIPCKATDGNAISGQAAIDYAPGTNPPFTVALGAEYSFRFVQHDAFARADWTYQSRNPWLAALQDPRNGAVYNPFAYTLPSTAFTTVRAGVYLGEWQISLFVDNLFGSARVTNYAQGQPSFAPTVQENDYTYRPRTFGINASWHVGAGH
ncbi:MAG: TonB-dependent receptor [Gammaproteobacteria bacterium]|nr:TonB-dependent receptor [Gammaproteobacteria bacterium]